MINQKISEIENFFNTKLEYIDTDVFSIIQKEFYRQSKKIELIASENIVSRAVLEAQGSIFTNKYAEGYPGNRYYGGCEFSDIIENLAIDRAKKLFSCLFANVQPNSGSQANQAVFLALLNPGDTFMGLNLNAGGHLTHGSPVNISGKWFRAIPYGVRREDHLIDMDQVFSLAIRNKPKLIIAGGSAYSRIWDWKKFREISNEIGAWLMVDMAHIAGLVAGGVHPSPIPFAHVVTTTTHKSLRGPRGGIILTNNEEISKKINSAIFPGLQGGPLMHVIAGKAVALGEALKPEFKEYTKNVVENAKIISNSLKNENLKIISNGTDNHIILIDLSSIGLDGKNAESILANFNIICNKNNIPFDFKNPSLTSGIRIGTLSGTTRGFRKKEFEKIGIMISQILNNKKNNISFCEKTMKKEILEMTEEFPIYSFLD